MSVREARAEVAEERLSIGHRTENGPDNLYQGRRCLLLSVLLTRFVD